MNKKQTEIKIVPNESYLPVEVHLPSLTIEPVSVDVPWIIRDGSISIVRWPEIKSRPVPVLIPELNEDGTEIFYIKQEWLEETVVYSTARVRGQLIQYRTETWLETRVTYIPTYLSVRRTQWIPKIDLSHPEPGFWERASMAILGGTRQEIRDLYASYDSREQLREMRARVGSQTKYEGIVQFVPSIINKLNIGNKASPLLGDFPDE